MPKSNWKSFYKQRRLKRLYRFFFPSAREKFLKELRGARKREVAKFLEPFPFIGKRKIISKDECVKLFPKMSVQIYGETEMSKTINIKGKEISEDTIVEALKKHCGFAEDEPLKVGDVVKSVYGLRIIVGNVNGILTSHSLDGILKHDGNLDEAGYTKIGTLDRIFAQAGFSL